MNDSEQQFPRSATQFANVGVTVEEIHRETRAAYLKLAETHGVSRKADKTLQRAGF